MLVNSNIKVILETIKYRLSFVEKGILNFHIKEFQDLNISDIEEYYNLAKEHLGNNKYPVLQTLGIGATIDNDVKEFASKSDKRFSIADGIVIDNLPHRLVANFYLKFHKPKNPTALFKKQSDAIEWLRKFTKNS
jgi:hypothetical protein